MYNTNQFKNPIQAPVMNFSMQQQQQQTPASTVFNSAAAAFATQDQNSNQQIFQQQQNFQSPHPSSHFNMPQMQTFETYPQVQTQINLAGMPPIVVSTERIDPTKYSVP